MRQAPFPAAALGSSCLASPGRCFPAPAHKQKQLSLKHFRPVYVTCLEATERVVSMIGREGQDVHVGLSGDMRRHPGIKLVRNIQSTSVITTGDDGAGDWEGP